MTTRFERYFDNQMRNPKMRGLIENELAKLDIGVQIAKLRQKRGLNQTQLAARAQMSGPKISKIETTVSNHEIDTLIRLASALGAHWEIKLVEKKAKRPRARYAAAGA